ncbi:hypothetical protein HDU98_007942 [Podochytrium sp. JEL0797]|nr:hypothetical protein HDU98_007942 [Podochytrium sp. JEL0797]
MPAVLFAGNYAVKVCIEVQECLACKQDHVPGKWGHLIGPDCSDLGIFNYNNRILITHQLLNEFTMCMAQTEETFNGLQNLRHESVSLICPHPNCGRNPKVVVPDGVSLAYPVKNKTEDIQPPTVLSNKSIRKPNVIRKKNSPIANHAVRKDLMDGARDYFKRGVLRFPKKIVAKYPSDAAAVKWSKTLEKRLHQRSERFSPERARKYVELIELTADCYFVPKVRNRNEYPNLKESVHKQRGDSGCQKHYESYAQEGLVGGFQVIICPHGICYGCHAFKNHEGRNDLFSAIYTR